MCFFKLVIDIVFFRHVHWFGLEPVIVAYPGPLTIKAPAKTAYGYVVCFICLLHIFANIIDLCKIRAKCVDPIQPAHIGTVYNVYLSTLMAVRLRMDAVQARTSNATHASQRESLKPQKLLT